MDRYSSARSGTRLKSCVGAREDAGEGRRRARRSPQEKQAIAAWDNDNTTEVIPDMLRRKAREQAGRSMEPRVAILDAQSVKTSCNPPEDIQAQTARKRSRSTSGNVATDTPGCCER